MSSAVGVTGRKPSAFLHEAGPTHQAARAGPPEQGSCPATGGNRTFSSFLLSAELVLMAGWPVVSDQGEASRRAFSRAEDKVCPIVLSKSKFFPSCWEWQFPHLLAHPAWRKKPREFLSWKMSLSWWFPLRCG